ncbi:MAG: M3 family oligoendopeptidase [Gemmataceae bacterium]|nr:M3 family oligoendopeptidase [Gemmataceae bacterium]
MSAMGVTWDLSDLYGSVADPQLERDLAMAHERALAFSQTYRGTIRLMEKKDAAVLAGALSELESLFEKMDKPAIYASLLHAAKLDDPSHGALVARTREERTRINQLLLFFELEWVVVPEEHFHQLLAEPVLQKYRHYLEHKRVWKPHFLTEPEEKVIDQKNLTGRAAFVRLFDESVAAITYPFGEEKLTFQKINAKLYDPDREARRRAAGGITQGLKEHNRLLTYLFNTLVVDHQYDCEMRSFADPMQPRHLANETNQALVDALMTSVEKHYPLVGRYYRLKKKLLGLEELEDFDRYAPIRGELPEVAWSDAAKLVRDSYHAFSPQAGEVVDLFFDKHWIDAELRGGKRGGAFSSSAVPSAHPYILMSYTGKMRDVATLAHELGHGLHQYLSRRMGYLQCDTPLTTAETASVFGEMLVFQKLLGQNQDPKVRLALLCGKIEDAFATVFRQVVLTRFEQSLHQARKKEGELPATRLNELWLNANQAMFGDSVRLGEGYSWWWSYIGHFIHSPFYCYAYSFGELLVLALVEKYRQEGQAFAPKYLDMLSRGGSESPVDLLARMGIDLTDPGFWNLGLKLLSCMVEEAEKLAAGAVV